MTNRLFISLDFPEEVLDKIISIRDEIYPDALLKWESKNKLHLTLKFLGDVEYEKTDSIIKIIEETIKINKNFNLKFKNFGLYFRNNRPRILWLGFSGNQSLFKIVDNLENKLKNIGFPKEKRRFHPHLTLLRLKGRENLDKIYAFRKYRLPNIEFNPKSISLMKSELKPSGSVYTTIKSFELN